MKKLAQYYCNLIITAVKVISDEGWLSFYRKFKLWLRLKRASVRRQIPLLPNIHGKISPEDVNTVIFPDPSKTPQVSIIIPAFNKWQYTLRCLKSISENTSGDYEVILVDDASNDLTKDIFSKIKNLVILKNEENRGFIESCNSGATSASGSYLLFLNNDTMVTKNWLSPLLKVIAEKDVAAVGSKLIYPNATLQEAGCILWDNGNAWNYGRGDNQDKPEYNYVREVDYCSGACLLVKKELFNELGGFDIRFKPGYYEDTDLCLSLRKLGYKIIYQPQSVVMHFEGVTGGIETNAGVKRYQEINKPKFIEKWSQFLLSEQYTQNSNNLFKARDRRMGKQILVFDETVPIYDKDSGSFRMFNLLKILVELGHRVTFVSDTFMRIQPYTEEIQQAGVEYLYSPHISSVERYLSNYGKYFNAVILSRAQVAMRYFDKVKYHCPQAKIIFDTVDLVFLRESRRADIEKNKKLAKWAIEYKEKELSLIKRSDITFVVSPVEKDLIHLEYPSAQVEIVSNIHQITNPRKSFIDRKDILFVGNFYHQPNSDAMIYFVFDIYPRIKQVIPDLKFYIVGNNPTKKIISLGSKDIVVAGYVNDLTSYFRDCKVFVAPLRYGAGVKGKINQSMSYGLPVVTTSIGAEGLGARHGIDILIADSPIDFAENVIALYDNEELWMNISKRSLENIKTNFSVEITNRKLNNILSSIVD